MVQRYCIYSKKAIDLHNLVRQKPKSPKKFFSAKKVSMCHKTTQPIDCQYFRLCHFSKKYPRSVIKCHRSVIWQFRQASSLPSQCVPAASRLAAGHKKRSRAVWRAAWHCSLRVGSGRPDLLKQKKVSKVVRPWRPKVKEGSHLLSRIALQYHRRKRA